MNVYIVCAIIFLIILIPRAWEEFKQHYDVERRYWKDYRDHPETRNAREEQRKDEHYYWKQK